MKSAITSILLSLIILTAHNALANEEGQSSIGLQGGQVTLSGDVGTVYGNALGWGLFYQYATSNTVSFEMSYATSRHSGTANGTGISLTQHSVVGDLVYTINHWVEFLPYAKAGVDFLMHSSQEVPGNGVNMLPQNFSGFGLNLGLGADYMLTENTWVGLDMDFHNMFDSTVQAPGVANVKVIQSFTTILARVTFKFGSADKKTEVTLEK